MIVRCVTAGTNPQGEPDFHFCKVECDDEQYSEGEHYFAAREQAERDGYCNELVVFDQYDIGEWFFENFVWVSATTVRI